MHRTIVTLLCLIILGGSVHADDLYRVWIGSESDASRLEETGAGAIVRVAGGYLVLVDGQSVKALRNSGLNLEFLASSVDRRSLAIDIDHDRAKKSRLPILYEEDNLRLYLVSGDVQKNTGWEEQLAPIPDDDLPIRYFQPMFFNPRASAGIADLDSLIDLVSQDSLTSYVERLQAFYRRVAGSDSGFAASDWMAAKFDDFGYDSVVFDSFTARVYGENKICRNVIATKVGSRHPEWQIIVGAHFDAVPASPGADDNGSGTAGVLELARILANVETDMTFIFIPFDAEETGLDGSWHYATRAAARGDHIVYMLNMDMIGEKVNDTRANLYSGTETAFTHLWANLADSLVGITATINGNSGGSDHYPFTQVGYQATFVQEYTFSTVYHTYQDSTTRMNFEYMTRMVGATLATAYVANILPPPVIITSIVDVGDGQSLQLNWVPMDPERIDHFWIYYWAEGSGIVDSMYISGSESSAVVSGLMINHPHGFYLLPFNADGQTSLEYETVYGTPHSIPGQLVGLKAMPVKYGVELHWHPNLELDISHYRLVRDGAVLPDIIPDTSFIDDDPGLGKAIHTYKAFAVDFDGNPSDTAAAQAVTSKAAWLDQGRILAINRSHISDGYYLVDEVVTGELMRQALSGLDYDYYSDTAHQGAEKASSLSLYDLIDYELVIVGGESAGLDDLGESASSGGRLDTLAYYLAIGGKMIVFGRWGYLDFEATIPYDPGSMGYAYHQYFGIAERNLVRTTSSGNELLSDLIGGHSLLPGYPDLTWDSTAAVNHSSPYTDVSGIPCVSYPTLNQPGIEILYTYNSSDDGGITEGQPMAWRNMGLDYQYVYFELPLSFMERNMAAAALGRAVLDFGFAAGKTVCADIPDIWASSEDTAHIYLGNLAGFNPSYIEVSSILINGSLEPAATAIMPSHPDFDGEVMEISLLSSVFASAYGEIVGDGYDEIYTVSWNYLSDAETRSAMSDIIVDGYLCGDANTDGTVNVGDAVFLIRYVFNGGPGPVPYPVGDVNSDGSANVGDAVYLITFIFKGGLPPGCPQ